MKSTMLKKMIPLISLVSLLAFFSMANAIAAEIGQTYYTKHNLMFEKGSHLATNYWRGERLPINAQVQLVKQTSKKIVLNYNGQEVVIKNVPKHTKATMDEIANRLLSSSSVSIRGRYAKEVGFGELRLGMTKDEVIMTRGYPPAHKTVSLESDRWVYWSSRFVQRTLVFQNGVLTEGRGL